MPNVIMELDTLKTEMAQRGWSVERLAKESGVPARTLYRIVGGEVRKPQAETLSDIQAAFDGNTADREPTEKEVKGEITAHTFESDEVIKWFKLLPESFQMIILFELIFCVPEDLRTRAMTAARNVEGFVEKHRKAAGEQRQESAKGAGR